LIDLKQLLRSAWASYMDRVIPKKAPTVQITECKRAFVAGAWVVMEVCKMIGEKETTEEMAVELLETMSRELDALTKELGE
jgi:hypothetical protein